MLNAETRAAIWGPCAQSNFEKLLAEARTHACTHVNLELHIAIKTEREAENSGSLSDSTKKGGVGVFWLFFFLHLNVKMLGAFASPVPHHGIQLSELKKYRRH